MIKSLLTTFLLIAATGSIISQTTKTFKGTVDYKFHLSSTNSIKPAKRLSWEKEFEPYSKKLDLLILYYETLNLGDINAAEKILIADTTLSKKNSFTLGYMFSLARMKQLGILYKPCVQINDDSEESRIIVCTIDEQKEFIKNANYKEYELRCKYIGNLIIDKTKVYQLISYK